MRILAVVIAILERLHLYRIASEFETYYVRNTMRIGDDDTLVSESKLEW